MRIPGPSSQAYQLPAASEVAAQDDASERDELTGEEQAALAVHHRHISETSYLPAPADYLHVR